LDPFLDQAKIRISFRREAPPDSKTASGRARGSGRSPLIHEEKKMRRTDPIRIGDLLGRTVENHPKLSRLFLEARVIEAWKALGPEITAQTTRVTIFRGKLNVWIASSALRQEIFIRRTELLRRINETVGQEVVTAIYVK
jgi:hypothetical protein